MNCLDANVWIYYFDRTLDEHDAVSASVRPLLIEETLFATTVLQMEVVHYVHAQLADPRERIERFLNLENVLVADLTAEDVEVGTELLDDHPHVGIGGRDATVVAAMKRNGVSRLWTHDAGLERLGRELDWLEVVDPVAE